MRITLVKKVLADGSPCRKCAEVVERLERDGAMARIDRIVVADERDPHSEGMVLAARYGVSLAPFFLVEADDGRTTVYTSYLRLRRDVLDAQVDEREELAEILDRNPDLDFL